MSEDERPLPKDIHVGFRVDRTTYFALHTLAQRLTDLTNTHHSISDACRVAIEKLIFNKEPHIVR